MGEKEREEERRGVRKRKELRVRKEKKGKVREVGEEI